MTRGDKSINTAIDAKIDGFWRTVSLGLRSAAKTLAALSIH